MRLAQHSWPADRLGAPQASAADSCTMPEMEGHHSCTETSLEMRRSWCDSSDGSSAHDRPHQGVCELKLGKRMEKGEKGRWFLRLSNAAKTTSVAPKLQAPHEGWRPTSGAGPILQGLRYFGRQIFRSGLHSVFKSCSKKDGKCLRPPCHDYSMALKGPTLFFGYEYYGQIGTKKR